MPATITTAEIATTAVKTETVDVPHLGGIRAGYAISGGGTIDPAKPTFTMINGLFMTSLVFATQFRDAALTSAANLIAVEPLGHGATTCPTEHFTFWDTAIVALQVMDRLGVDKAYAMGMAQGGAMITRMALLAPERIRGLVLIGTSMDYESTDSRAKGSWDAAAFLRPFTTKWSTPNPDFVMDEETCELIAKVGLGPSCPPEKVAFWTEVVQGTYRGDEGRKKARMAMLALLTRDGLLFRLSDVRCPVHWLQGESASLYGKIMPVEQLKMFTSAPRTDLTFVPEGGGLCLSETNPVETADAMLKMIAADQYPSPQIL